MQQVRPRADIRLGFFYPLTVNDMNWSNMLSNGNTKLNELGPDPIRPIKVQVLL